MQQSKAAQGNSGDWLPPAGDLALEKHGSFIVCERANQSVGIIALVLLRTDPELRLVPNRGRPFRFGQKYFASEAAVAQSGEKTRAA